MKNKKIKKLKQEFQKVYFRLADGTVLVYSGQVQVRPGNNPLIVEIKFTEPIELPKDMSWETV